MSEKEIKVTDKRMFTANGELREEYRQAKEDQEPEPQPQPTPPPESTSGFEPAESSTGQGEPTFFDLVSVIAEPISLYLGDSTLTDGREMENLEIARMYIDLLEVLRQKSVGNLDPEEQNFLDELLYRTRMRYVQKSG